MEWMRIEEKLPLINKYVWVRRDRKVGKMVITSIFKAYYKDNGKWSYIYPNEKNLLINPLKWKEF